MLANVILSGIMATDDGVDEREQLWCELKTPLITLSTDWPDMLWHAGRRERPEQEREQVESSGFLQCSRGNATVSHWAAG